MPAANCVLRFDPVLTPVSFVQGRGRARQGSSSFLVLSERPDRTAAHLAEAEQLQLRLVKAFDPTKPPVGANGSDAAAIAAQRSREKVAFAILVTRGALHGVCCGSASVANAIAQLNLWCQKTKIVLCKSFSKGNSEGSDCKWLCTLGYSSALRSLQASGSGPDRKSAYNQAAMLLMQALLDAVSAEA